MSGLNINFNKSEMVVSGVDQHKKVRIANLLNCKLSAFPIKYLGLPVSDRRLSLEDWGFLVGNVGHRVDPWQGKFMSSAARLTLTNACLSSLPTHAMCLHLLYEGTHTAMDKCRCRFFWEGVGERRRYHLVDWATVCSPKESGGLGIVNTKLMNLALISKWIWKLSQNEQGVWAELIRAKQEPLDLTLGKIKLPNSGITSKKTYRCFGLG